MKKVDPIRSAVSSAGRSVDRDAVVEAIVIVTCILLSVVFLRMMEWLIG